jgi:hypothetical protein
MKQKKVTIMCSSHLKKWNLAAAYKQVPLSEHANENDSYLVVCCPETRGPKKLKQKILEFCSVASGTASLRVANAIWKIGTKFLRFVWTSYFDDFSQL